MKAHTKKYLSIFLAAIMILAILPMNLFAEEETRENTPKTKEEVTVKEVTNDNGEPKAEDSKTDAQKIDPKVPEKTAVENTSNLTDDEKDTVKKAVENANKGNFPEETTVEIGDDGTATITYPDGSEDTIPGSDLVKGKTDAEKTTPNVPEKTAVDNTTKLTDDEKSKVKKAVEDANKGNFPEGTEVSIEDNGIATITYPDKTTDTIPGNELVKAKEFTITFDSQGGSAIKSKTTKNQVLEGIGVFGKIEEAYKDKLEPKRDGFEFLYWYKIENGKREPITNKTKFTEDTKLFAFWVEKTTCKAYITDATVYSDRVEGKATPDAKVTLYRSDGTTIGTVTADSNGYFTIYTSYFYNSRYNRWYDNKWYDGHYYYGYRTGYLIARKTGCVESAPYYLNDYYYGYYGEKYWYGDKYWDKEYQIYPTNISRTHYSVSGDTRYANTRISVYDGNTYLGSTWTDKNGYFHLTWNSPSVSTGRNLEYYVGDKSNTNYATSPVIKEAAADAKFVKGTAGSYAKITVRDNYGTLLGSTTADKNGNFTAYLNRVLRPGETIKVTADENTKYDRTTTYVVKGVTKTADLTRRAYIAGYPDGSFRPQGNVTRAEAAQMFATLLNGSTNFGTSTQTKFSDANNAWYSKAVNYIVGKGLISGYEDGTFKPNNNITRAEFAQMISGYIQKGYPGTGSFKDVKGHWASEAIDKVYGNKVVKGYPNGTFQPNREITRAEAVTILNAVFDRTTNQKSLNNVNIRNLKTFTDVHANFWGYYEILDAANNHNAYKLSDVDRTDIWK